MVASANEQKFFIALLITISSLAWLTLWIWGSSPSGGYAHSHGHVGHAAGIIANPLALFFLFLISWTLMTVAMMLPTSVPLLTLFYTITRRRADRPLLAFLVVTGYLLVWMLFGVLAYVGILGLRQAAEHIHFLQANVWLLGATTLIVAGLFQFSSLKYRCLDKCRSPLSFIVEHWRGSDERQQAFRLGAHHGIFCIGCCWALMLLMFPLGAGNIGWMLTLGMLMAIEKNNSWGRQLSKPLGVVLLGMGIIIALRGDPWLW
jgi:predicted metal-binding membrane protein